MTTLIKSVRLFDGHDIHAKADVLVQDGKIVEVSNDNICAPSNARIVDGSGKTLLPGLIDAHVHAQAPALEQNILFGVTTCLDMYSLPDWMYDLRKQAAENDDCADIRSASCGGTVMKVSFAYASRCSASDLRLSCFLKGHPSMLIGKYFPRQFPTVASVEDVAPFVAERIKEGADYVCRLLRFIRNKRDLLSRPGLADQIHH